MNGWPASEMQRCLNLLSFLVCVILSEILWWRNVFFKKILLYCRVARRGFLDKILRAMLLNIRWGENRRFFPTKLSMISLWSG